MTKNYINLFLIMKVYSVIANFSVIIFIAKKKSTLQEHLVFLLRLYSICYYSGHVFFGFPTTFLDCFFSGSWIKLDTFSLCVSQTIRAGSNGRVTVPPSREVARFWDVKFWNAGKTSITQHCRQPSLTPVQIIIILC